MTPRRVGLFGALCVIAGWALGTTLSPPVASLQSPAPEVVRAAAPSPPSHPSPYAERLREKLDASAQQRAAPRGRRNPFAFEVAGRESRPAFQVPAAEAAPPTPLPATPRVELSGIATSMRDGMPAYTAILVIDGVLQFAAAGERVGGGYEVIAITDASARLRGPGGEDLLLHLR